MSNAILRRATATGASASEGEIIRSVAGIDVYFDENSPFSTNNSLKTRWLVTSSVAGLFGALVIGGAFLLTYDRNPMPSTTTEPTTKLSSLNTQKSMISNKADQTEKFIGDIPVLVEKNVTNDLKLGHKFTNVEIAFGRTKITSKDDAVKTTMNTIVVPGTVTADVVSPGMTKPKPLSPNFGNTIEPAGNIVIASVENPAITGMEIAKTEAPKPTVLPKSSNKSSKQILKLATPPKGTPLKPAANETRLAKRAPANKPVKVPMETVSVSAGDTLVDILVDHGAHRVDATGIVTTLRPHFPRSALKVGQKVTFALVSAIRGGNNVKIPDRLEVAIGKNTRLTVIRNKRGQYKMASLPKAKIRAVQGHAQVKIKKSLYIAARNQGIPDKIIVDMMRIHAYDVDFQRQVRVGDSFEVFYGDETTFKHSKADKVLFSSLNLSGKTKGYYRFKTPDDKIVSYYDKTGRSSKKFLMRTPINGARLTSGYGMRRHPILRYNKMHRGVDFAAPRGTPIKAAGNGVIEKKGGVGGYGRYIRIKHANGYETAYAHMSRYASGIRPGTRVRQGQIIGYVGSTGRATGNHLHYEVWINGKAVNPMRVKGATGRRLTGKMLVLFKNQMVKIDTLRKKSSAATQVAAARDANFNGGLQ